ncbi:MAG: hypothetical protein ABI134_16140, partial [Byssovorax sp.]
EMLQTFLEDQLFAKLMDSKLMQKLLGAVFRGLLKATLKLGLEKLANLLTKVAKESLAKKIAQEIVSGVIKAIYGESFGGKIGGAAKDRYFDPTKQVGDWVTDPFGTASGKMADGIASWVDGLSESVPSGSARQP